MRIQKTGSTSFGENIMPRFCNASGQKCYGSLHYSTSSESALAADCRVTFLRDPVERLLSEFTMLRGHEGENLEQDHWDFAEQDFNWLHSFVNRSDMEDALLAYVRSPDNPSRNRQAMYLLGFDRVSCRSTVCCGLCTDRHGERGQQLGSVNWAENSTVQTLAVTPSPDHYPTNVSVQEAMDAYCRSLGKDDAITVASESRKCKTRRFARRYGGIHWRCYDDLAEVLGIQCMANDGKTPIECLQGTGGHCTRTQELKDVAFAASERAAMVPYPAHAFDWDGQHDELLARAKEALDGLTAFGITDCFADSMRGIAQGLGWDEASAVQFGTEIHAREQTKDHLMLVSTRQGASAVHRSKWASRIDPYVEGEIRERSRIDHELVLYAKKRYYELYGKTCQ